MSLTLDRSNPVITAHCVGAAIGDPSCGVTLHPTPGGEPIEIHSEDMTALVLYWLTNTDLNETDERVILLAAVRRLRRIPGFNRGALRLGELGES